MFSTFITFSLLANLITPIQIEREPIETLLDALAICESGNQKWAVRNDDGGGNSYSYLQFKPETFKHFAQRYNLPFDDIFNREQQFAVAKEMLKENRFDHWALCFKKLKIML